MGNTCGTCCGKTDANEIENIGGKQREEKTHTDNKNLIKNHGTT